MKVQSLQEGEAVEFFGPDSLLPVDQKCSFTIERLESAAHVNVKERAVRWVRTYHLKKTRDAHEGPDHWFEVTGCPAGECVRASDGSGGYAFRTLEDHRGNLVHFVSFGSRLVVGQKIVLILEFVTRRMETEDKLLLIGETPPLHKSFFLRTDHGYAVAIDAFELTVTASDGRVTGAWPRTLSERASDNTVRFAKRGLRPYEVLTPLVHIEAGSKRTALVVRALGTFALGVAASLLATVIL
jgi:hypothetical protein